MKTWKGKMIKHMLTRRKESDSYLATVSRHRCSRQITMRVDKMYSFQPALTPAMSSDSSQVGFALFPSY